MFAVLRAVREHKHGVLRRAVRAYPKLGQFVDAAECIWVGEGAFHRRLQVLTLQSLQEEEKEVLQGSPPQASKDAHLERIHRFQRAWAEVRRVAPFIGLYDEQQR
eukprot:5984649-Pyramimonas_sp.AAC.1